MTTPTSVGAPSPEVALKDKLRGRGVYEVGPAGVDLAPYRSSLVSLPASLEGSPNLTDLLPPEVRVFFLDGEYANDEGRDKGSRRGRWGQATIQRYVEFCDRQRPMLGVFLSGSLLKPSCVSSLTFDQEICETRFSCRGFVVV